MGRAQHIQEHQGSDMENQFLFVVYMSSYGALQPHSLNDFLLKSNDERFPQLVTAIYVGPTQLYLDLGRCP